MSEVGTAPDESAETLLTMSGIVKTFPGVRALDGVDLEVRAGEVHCLLGQNGAGKSTLIKVLSGAHQPDGGEIVWRGRPATLGSPVAALNLGIATMYQELDLVDGTLGGGEHLPRPRARWSSASPSRRQMRNAARALMRRLGHPEIPADREVGLLSAAGQQLVSMARALVARRPADRHGRADRRARRGRGRQPVPRSSPS